MNVNTTDATTGATALLLPAQNTHTLHDPIGSSASLNSAVVDTKISEPCLGSFTVEVIRKSGPPSKTYRVACRAIFTPARLKSLRLPSR